MATTRWQSGAKAVAQVQSWTFAGTWEADDVVRITIGSKSYDFTGGSTTINTAIDNIVTAYNALSSTYYPEFAEMTASRSGSAFVLTADTLGKPFTATLTPLESDLSGAGAQTIEGGTTATTGTASTANAGPNAWSSAGNWSGGAVPVNGDTVVIADGSEPILYGLDQSAVTLAELVINASYVKPGAIGLPKINEDNPAASYPEYRDDYLKIGATLLTIGLGEGTGSGRIKINLGSVQTTANIYSTGTGDENNLEALLLRGTHASNVLTVNGQSSVGVAVHGGETSVIATLKTTGQAEVRCGAGVTLTTVTNYGGTLEINSAVGTSLVNELQAGQTTVNGTGAVAALKVRGGTVVYNTTGTLGGAPVVSNDGVLDFSQDGRVKTVTNPIEVYGNGSVIDPGQVVSSLVIDCNEATAANLQIGTNVRITRGTPA